MNHYALGMRSAQVSWPRRNRDRRSPPGSGDLGSASVRGRRPAYNWEDKKAPEREIRILQKSRKTRGFW